jgi:hypothetical protein
VELEAIDDAYRLHVGMGVLDTICWLRIIPDLLQRRCRMSVSVDSWKGQRERVQSGPASRSRSGRLSSVSSTVVPDANFHSTLTCVRGRWRLAFWRPECRSADARLPRTTGCLALTAGVQLLEAGWERKTNHRTDLQRDVQEDTAIESRGLGCGRVGLTMIQPAWVDVTGGPVSWERSSWL